jgi:hypothetical protein
VRRSVLQRVGGFEESFGGLYQMYEDQAFLAKVYLTTPVFVSAGCWTRYRQHPDACSTVIRDSGHYASVRQFFLEYLERYLRAQEIRDPQVWRAIERAWWPYRYPYLAGVRQFWKRAWRRVGRARVTQF